MQGDEDFTSDFRTDQMSSKTKSRKRPNEAALKDLIGSMGSEYSDQAVLGSLRRSDFVSAFGLENAAIEAAEAFGVESFLAQKAEDTHGAPATPSRASSSQEPSSVDKKMMPPSNKRAKFFDVIEERLKLQAKAKKELGELQARVDKVQNLTTELSNDPEVAKDDALFAMRVSLAS